MENVFHSVKKTLTNEDLRKFESENNIVMPLKIREHSCIVNFHIADPIK